MTQLLKEELELLQEQHSKFLNAKMILGELELKKQDILREIGMIQSDSVNLEKMFIKKYGEGSVINLQTGIVTQKENG